MVLTDKKAQPGVGSALSRQVGLGCIRKLAQGEAAGEPLPERLTPPSDGLPPGSASPRNPALLRVPYQSTETEQTPSASRSSLISFFGGRGEARLALNSRCNGE